MRVIAGLLWRLTPVESRKPPVVEPAIFSKQMGWVGAGTTTGGSRSTTQAYYDWMNSGAACWPGSGPKEW
jgi:hypothetical protein